MPHTIEEYGDGIGLTRAITCWIPADSRIKRIADTELFCPQYSQADVSLKGDCFHADMGSIASTGLTLGYVHPISAVKIGKSEILNTSGNSLSVRAPARIPSFSRRFEEFKIG
jgi:hypothetical protein